MSLPEKKPTQIIREAVNQLCDELTMSLTDLGFKHSKKWFWTRIRNRRVEFFHLHRMGSSYGGSPDFSVRYRVHFGVRDLSSDFVAAALNGPSSDSEIAMSARYHLRFNAKSGSTYERCLKDIERVIREVGEPWFYSYVSEVAESGDPNILLLKKLLGINLENNSCHTTSYKAP